MKRALAIASLLVGCGPDERFDCEQPGAVCTVLGTGDHGFDGDGHKPTQTMINFPTAVRFAADGSPLVDDFNNLRIRTIENGRVKTLAGSGWHAFAKDGIEATDAALENPVDLWPLPDGGFAVVELHAARVLVVDNTGWLSVLAGSGDVGYTGDGGPARQARMSEAWGVARDDHGILYVADTDNHCIRAIDPSTGLITGVAGNGTPGSADGPFDQATFNEPTKMDWHDGALYVADRENHRIRRLDFNSRTVETVAGTGAPGYTGDGGDALGAQLQRPYGLDVDEDGTLWIADSENHAIRRVDPDGTIQTVVGGFQGNGAAKGMAEDSALSVPQHVQVAPDGTIWISDTFNSQIRVYVPE